MDTESRDQLCCDIINQYLFDHVWNEPVSEYRINIHPQLVKTSSVSGSFQAIDSSIYLPTDNEPYFVWYMKYSDTNIGLNLDVCKWYDTATVCNQFNTLIHAYLINGVMMPKGSVYIRYNYSKSLIFIAVKKRAFTLYGNVSQIDKLYLTIYYDSDVPNPINVLSVYVESRGAIRSIQQRVEEFIRYTGIRDDTQLTVFKNGIEVTRGIVPITDFGTWYDYIVDKNIIGKVNIEIGNNSEDPVFLSTMDSVWKQLIHIPRAVNPNNAVITHNTCDIFVRNKDKRTPYGVYLHRVTATGRTVSQVTHNDMAVPLFIIDAYRDYLQTQNVSLHIVLRKHDKDNVLIPNSEYIDLLYADVHTDKDIVNILTGKGPDYLPFWRADSLEACEYVKMMFDVPEQFATTANITKYIDTFGYYNTVNMLCKRIVDTTITDSYDGSITYNLPLMFLGLTVIPIVYLNGKMLLTTYYTYQTSPESNTCKISISRDIYIKPGDKVSVIFNLTANNNTYKVQPIRSKLSFVIPYNEPKVYEIISVAPARGVGNNSTSAYKLCPRLGNIYTLVTNSDGTTTITFNDGLIGKTFIIENGSASYLKTYNLSTYTDTGASIAIPITTTVTDSDEVIPILGYKSLNVYLNRDYLVQGIDYFVNEIKDDDGNVALSELVVQTMDSFVEGTDDILTVVYTVSDTDDISNGFSINDKLYDQTPINLVYDNITTIHVEGSLERGATYQRTYTDIPSGVYREGSVFEIKTVVPKVISDFLNSYHRAYDANRVALLNQYFADKIPDDPDVLIMECKRRIYSTLLNNFINDIVSGKITVVYDPDTNRMNSAIRPYMYLKDMDLVFKQDNDQRFLDYYAQYVNYEIDTALKPVIDLFINTFMPKNVDPTMEVVYQNG